MSTIRMKSRGYLTGAADPRELRCRELIEATIRAVIGVQVFFRFHGELNDFLPAERRHTEFEQTAGVTDTVKHVVESLGVPHTEVGSVDVNGLAYPLDRPFSASDRVQVFPHRTPLLLVENRFVADGHLGRLAAYLRMLGFDTWYERDADDALLASIASEQNRLLLTRDVGLLKRREVEQGYCIRFHKPLQQLREVTHRFALTSALAPFTRCMACNGILHSVPKSEVAECLPPHARETKEEFSRCQNCGKIFWRGSHHARMLGWIQELTVRE